ncbi:hypothetical protein ABW21_db0202138 [Orbilia brochopaga]|nr:hypothetical protein ABW21_db0202138 [Drechslerella brochopaga]
MASPTANILRWSFLAFGVLYGFQHQRTLYKQEREHHAKQEWDRQEKLIELAKAEYQKSLLPPEKRNTSQSPIQSAGHVDLARYPMPIDAGYIQALTTICATVISNPDDPKFDLEAYLVNVAANEAKAKV